ncbi:hypothetical protein AgCh_007839 [Apium graveolens]
MNHLSSEKLWWMESATKRPIAQNGLFSFNQNHQENTQTAQDVGNNSAKKESGEEIVAEREAMFEKPLTPSDVGKLNRLVVPKQHAERYFPIGGNSSGGGVESVEKGLLLSFEDDLGKMWNFRYSYWNSSQSYVLTKGWSRFVKEKQLQAGDTIVFERFKDDGDRFFIGWRRRSTVVAQPAGGWTPGFYSGHPYPSQNSRPNGPPLPYQPHCLHAGFTTFQIKPYLSFSFSFFFLFFFLYFLICYYQTFSYLDIYTLVYTSKLSGYIHIFSYLLLIFTIN